MPIHVAIMMRPYLKLVLAGRKTIESRLTKSLKPPFKAIAPGERIFFKASSGPFMATAVAAAVEFFQDLTPSRVAELCKRFNHAVCGDTAFWQWKRDSRYATFITLRDVQAIDVGPVFPPSRGPAWFVLPDGAAPPVTLTNAPEVSPAPDATQFDIELTGGAIRNRYVRVPRRVHQFDAAHYGPRTGDRRGRPLRLLLDDREIETDIRDDDLIRWRGWLAFFESHRAKPGDCVRFVQLAPGRYRVTLIRRDPPRRAKPSRT